MPFMFDDEALGKRFLSRSLLLKLNEAHTKHTLTFNGTKHFCAAVHFIELWYLHFYLINITLKSLCKEFWN